MERQLRRDLQAYLLVLQKVDLTAKIVDFADQRDVLLHDPHVVDPMNLADGALRSGSSTEVSRCSILSEIIA